MFNPIKLTWSLIIVITVMCGSADANWIPRYQEVGARWFPPACSPVSIDRTHSNELAEDNGYLAHSIERTCTIYLTRRWELLSYRLRCAVIVHEYGHLSGLGHSDDPTNIMYPVLTPDGADIPACKWNRRRGRNVR